MSASAAGAASNKEPLLVIYTHPPVQQMFRGKKETEMAQLHQSHLATVSFASPAASIAWWVSTTQEGIKNKAFPSRWEVADYGGG